MASYLEIDDASLWFVCASSKSNLGFVVNSDITNVTCRYLLLWCGTCLPWWVQFVFLASTRHCARSIAHSFLICNIYYIYIYIYIYYSKRIHRNLVLELRDELSRSIGTRFDKEKRLAQVSTDASLPARQRAFVQGREDEAAIQKYLQREKANSNTYMASEASHAHLAKPSAAAAAHISSRSLDDARPPRPTAPRQQRRASMPTSTVRPSDAFSTDLQCMDRSKDDSNLTHP